MDRSKALNIVNPVLFAAACVQMISGFALGPAGVRPAYIIHRYNAFFLFAMIAAHIVLNWNWVKAFLSKRQRNG